MRSNKSVAKKKPGVYKSMFDTLDAVQRVCFPPDHLMTGPCLLVLICSSLPAEPPFADSRCPESPTRCTSEQLASLRIALFPGHVSN
jgi:hypothetical protein